MLLLHCVENAACVGETLPPTAVDLITAPAIISITV